MSIEKRAGTLSRSFRTLIEKPRGVAKFIKVLQTLNLFAGSAAIDIKVLKDLSVLRTSRAIDIQVLRT